MADPRLVTYIAEQELNGYSPEQLREYLIQKGFDPAQIDEAIEEAREEPNAPPPQAPTRKDASSTPPATESRKDAQSGGSFTKRSPVLVAVLSLITFGIYAIIWLVKTSNELRSYAPSAPNPKMLLLLLVPFIGMFAILWYSWMYSKAVQEASGYNNVTLFLLIALLFPIGAAIAQSEFNKKA